LPVSYFHIVFTLPHELSALVLQNKRLLYDLLFRASAATLLELAGDHCLKRSHRQTMIDMEVTSKMKSAAANEHFAGDVI
jgi:hypothetical protein